MCINVRSGAVDAQRVHARTKTAAVLAGRVRTRSQQQGATTVPEAARRAQLGRGNPSLRIRHRDRLAHYSVKPLEGLRHRAPRAVGAGEPQRRRAALRGRALQDRRRRGCGGRALPRMDRLAVPHHQRHAPPRGRVAVPRPVPQVPRQQDAALPMGRLRAVGQHHAGGHPGALRIHRRVDAVARRRRHRHHADIRARHRAGALPRIRQAALLVMDRDLAVLPVRVGAVRDAVGRRVLVLLRQHRTRRPGTARLGQGRRVVAACRLLVLRREHGLLRQ